MNIMNMTNNSVNADSFFFFSVEESIVNTNT